MGCDVHGPHLEKRRAVDELRTDAPVEYHWEHICKFSMSRNYRIFALMAEVRKSWPFGRPPDDHILKVLKAHGITNDEDFAKLSDAEKAQMAKEAQDNGITMGMPSFEEKGMPRDISWRTADDYLLLVVDQETDEAGCCTREQAERWVKSGSSEVWAREQVKPEPPPPGVEAGKVIDVLPEGGEKAIVPVVEGKILKITGPDWHTPSWLSTQEVEALVERYMLAQIAVMDPERVRLKAAQVRFDDAYQQALAKCETDGERAIVTNKMQRLVSFEHNNPLKDDDLVFLQGMLAIMKTLEEEDRPCRIVFWFDN